MADIYDTPRTEVSSNLQSSVGAYLAEQILAAIDSGAGGQSSEISIVSDFVPGDAVPANTDIVLVRPGEGGALNVPGGVGAIIFTGPVGVSVSLNAQDSVGVQLTSGADVVTVTTDASIDPSATLSFSLGEGNDVFTGALNVRNNVIGGVGDDTLSGGNKNDSFDIGQGNDKVDAGNGFDQAFIRGSIKDYTTTINADGSISLLNKLTNEVTTMKNLEFLTFEQGGVLLNVTTETGFASASLYEVVLGRSADAGGFEFYSGTDGTKLIEAANGMLGSDEFASKFGPINQLSDTQFLDVMYQTAFNRDADSGGLKFWLDKIAEGMSRGEVAVRFAYSAEAQSAFDTEIIRT
jgi:Ca2+-binding RTX toxin-like protein